MKAVLLALIPLLIPSAVRADIQSDYPDIFPKSGDTSQKGNGWPLIASLPEMASEDSKTLPKSNELDPANLQKPDAARMASLAERNRQLLKQLNEAMNSPVLQSDSWRNFDMDDDSFKFSMPALQGLRLMMINDLLAGRDGKPGARALDSALRGIEFGLRFCEAEPLLVEMMIGRTMILLSAVHAATAGTLPKVSPAELEGALKRLERFDRAGPVMRAAILGEARWSLRQIEPLLTGGEACREQILSWAINRQAVSESVGKQPPTEKLPGEKSETEAIRRMWKKEMPKHVADALSAAETFDWRKYANYAADYFRALRAADTGSQTAFDKSFHAPKADALFKNTPLAFLGEEILNFNTEEVYIESICVSSAAVRLCQGILVLKLYELKHGKLPESLDALVPDFCAKVPLDPFDGKPMRYDAKLRRLWCVGANLKDERGEWDVVGEGSRDDQAMILP